MKKKFFLFFLLIFAFCITNLFANTFNEKLTTDEKINLDSGSVLIRNIDFYKNICLDKSDDSNIEIVKKEIHDLQPKYLAEVIQIKPYLGNEDLPQKLRTLLYNVGDYAGIPYWSEQKQKWFNLYDSASIENENSSGSFTELNCIFKMQPFGIVEEYITLSETNNEVIYITKNMNKLRYHDKFDCVYPQKMKMCIILFRDGDNWILYGIGGVNAPRIPFFTERIETSFINRIKTFCNFIFEQF